MGQLISKHKRSKGNAAKKNKANTEEDPADRGPDDHNGAARESGSYTPNEEERPADRRGGPCEDAPEAPGAVGRSLVVVALYSHTSRATTELSFEPGDRFEVIDKPNQDYWWVRRLQTGEFGFVISSYVVSATSLEIQEWYFGEFSRKEAEKILLKDPTFPVGTFLVRLTEPSSAHAYSLSVRASRDGYAVVKHHRIFRLGDQFHIHRMRPFQTLHDLISYYSESIKGQHILLTKVCPKPLPPQWDLSHDTRDEWEIDRTTLECDRRLGSGNFGDVWHGYWNGTREVAIKTLKDGTMSAELFLQEAGIMKKLRHKNILILYAVCTLEEPILIITEFMNKGALLEVLRNEGKLLDLADLVDICAQVAAGMKYLEDMGLIHRDLAARNVLVDTHKQCKVADFGLARIVDSGEYNPNNCKNFPVKWTAPEAIIYGTYSIKSDVWSFGILMMEVLTLGAIPYPGMTNAEVMDLVPRGYRMQRPLAPIECPEGLFDHMGKCWYENKDSRPTFEYLENYLSDWDAETDIEYEDPEHQSTE